MIKKYIHYLKDNPQRYWFKAKLYGWGWTPATWQGWTVFFVFITLIALNAFRIESASGSSKDVPIDFIFETIGLALILIFICWKTGEKPHWQWGLPDKYKKH